MLPYSAMLGKILLTAVVFLGAYLVIRARIQRSREPSGAPPPCLRASLVPAGTAKALAFGLVVMVGGNLVWLYLDYEAGREVVTIHVINANTGDVTTYQARRADVQGRRFPTVDGRPIILADVDRMELEAGRQKPMNRASHANTFIAKNHHLIGRTV